MTEQDTHMSTATDRMTDKPANSRLVEILQRKERHLSPEYIEALEDGLQAAAIALQDSHSHGGTVDQIKSLKLNASHEVSHTGNRWKFTVPCEMFPHSLAYVARDLDNYIDAHLSPQQNGQRIDVAISEGEFYIRAPNAAKVLEVVNKALLEPNGITPIDENLAPDVGASKEAGHDR